MKKFTAYLSHAIRGSKGMDATNEDMQRNCEEALELAKFLRIHIPEIDFYVPAEHEDFVDKAYASGYLTVKQVLDVDCQILGSKDLHIVFVKDGWTGGGIVVEIEYARSKNKNIIYIHDTDDKLEVIIRILRTIQEMEGKDDA
jgi:hypothetical protein